MDRVEALEWQPGDTQARWRLGETTIEMSYGGEITAVVLKDGSGVAIVEPIGTAAGRNAVVVNADGSERFRVEPGPSRHVAFQQIYYVRDELTAISFTSGSDWATVVDADSGRVVRTYETR